MALLVAAASAMDALGVEFPLAHAAVRRGWTRVHEWAEGDDWWLFVVATNAFATAIYWFWSAPYLVLDACQVRCARRFKTQPGKNEPLDWAKVLSSAALVLFNQVVVGPALAATLLPLLRARGISYSPDDIPGVSTFLRHLCGYIVVEEIGFYYAHRLFHESAFLYRNFHKRHHIWTAPIGFTARHAHPVEDVFANVLPVMMGCVAMNSHMVLWWFWLAIALFATISGHSGYHLPFMASNEFHDTHHEKFQVNFGSFGWLDALHGTDSLFRGSINERRHHTILGWHSARDEVPDEAGPADPVPGKVLVLGESVGGVAAVDGVTKKRE